jgi:hypothetical protein
MVSPSALRAGRPLSPPGFRGHRLISVGIPVTQYFNCTGNTPLPIAALERENAKTTKLMDLDWQGFARDLGRHWATALRDLASGALSFKDFMKTIFTDILNAFLDMIAKMVAGWFESAIFGLFASFFMAPLTPILGPTGSLLGGAVPMQSGFSGVISAPTLAILGEAGPERVDIAPLGRASTGERGGGGTININMTVHAMDGASVVSVFKTQLVPLIQGALNRGVVHAPRGAMGGI